MVCKLNIPPAPFKGGDVTVSRMERGDDLTINIPPAPFKGGDVTVSKMGRRDGQQDGKM